MASTNSLIQLGRRLRERVDPADAAAYDEYRAEFAEALGEVAARCRTLSPGAKESARLKTLESVRAKLNRQQIRLPRIQDIAGVRFVVETTDEQDRLVHLVREEFPGAHLDDYRWNSQHGYRAVHVVVKAPSGYSVEIQIRTAIQNAWANTCEVLAVEVDQNLKYGGGPPEIAEKLTALSDSMRSLELSRMGEDQLEADDSAAFSQLAELVAQTLH